MVASATNMELSGGRLSTVSRARMGVVLPRKQRDRFSKLLSLWALTKGFRIHLSRLIEASMHARAGAKAPRIKVAVQKRVVSLEFPTLHETYERSRYCKSAQ